MKQEMSKLSLIPVLFALILNYSCSVSTKNLDSKEENGFYFNIKSKYTTVNDANYQISIPSKLNDEGKGIVKIKDRNGEKVEREINKEVFSQVQSILNSNDVVSKEKSIQKILNLES
jgi:hypothetical protein